MSNEVMMAERELRAAQERLDAARKREADLEGFPVRGEVHVVMAKVPSFDQFVSYPAGGILVAAFTDHDEAVRYTRTFAAPVGTDFVIETTVLRG